MTYAPPALTALARYWTSKGGVNLGVVGDTRHQTKGRSYHLGASQLTADAYSRQTPRDRAGLSEAASALDLGALNGNLGQLRTFSRWFVERCRSNAPGTSDVREFIYSPDGKTVLRWDRQRGINSAPRAGEADDSHLSHSHISFYRDSERRSKVGLFSPYFATPLPEPSPPKEEQVIVVLANSKSPLTSRKRIAKGKPLYRLESAWGEPVPLVNMAGDYTLTVLGDGSGPYDLIVITTGGVTQYALALKADLAETPDFPIAQEYVPFVSTRPPYEVRATAYSLPAPLESHPGFLLEPIGAPVPAGGFPVFVLVHGGPLLLGNADNLIDVGNRIAGRGGIVFLIDYRSMPSQGAGYPQTVWDVANCVIQARTMKKLSWRSGITLVAHSFGGYPASILALGGVPDMLPAGLPDVYVAVAAISSTAGVIPGTLAGAPDPLLLGSNRSGLPVTVVRGSNDFIATADNKNGFALALHNGDHPGRNVLVLGADHESVLMADVTLDAIFEAGGHA